MKTFCCKACRGTRLINPRNPNQQYCNRADCQRARKRAWQRKKRATDPQYRKNQIDCQERWREQHPEYWQAYRKSKKKHHRPLIRPLQRWTGYPHISSSFQENASAFLYLEKTSRWTRSRPLSSLFQPVATLQKTTLLENSWPLSTLSRRKTARFEPHPTVPHRNNFTSAVSRQRCLLLGRCLRRNSVKK